MYYEELRTEIQEQLNTLHGKSNSFKLGEPYTASKTTPLNEARRCSSLSLRIVRTVCNQLKEAVSLTSRWANHLDGMGFFKERHCISHKPCAPKLSTSMFAKWKSGDVGGFVFDGNEAFGKRWIGTLSKVAERGLEAGRGAAFSHEFSQEVKRLLVHICFPLKVAKQEEHGLATAQAKCRSEEWRRFCTNALEHCCGAAQAFSYTNGPVIDPEARGRNGTGTFQDIADGYEDAWCKVWAFFIDSDIDFEACATACFPPALNTGEASAPVESWQRYSIESIRACARSFKKRTSCPDWAPSSHVGRISG